MSFGTTSESELLQKAIQDADAAGILMVGALGNDGIVEYPAAYSEVIAVGAINGIGDRCEFSPREDSIELVAPGEDVLATGFLGGCTVTSGTSMAAPHVTGVASVLLQKDNSGASGSVLTEDQIKNLRAGAIAPDIDSNYAHLSKHPSLHGGGCATTSLYSAANYMCAYKYAIKCIQKGVGFSGTMSGLTSSEMADIRNIINKYRSKGRAYMYGIAIHGVTDAFAHATYRYDGNIGKWRHMNHLDTTEASFKADNKGNIPKRYMTALQVTKNIIKRYIDNGSWETAAKDFYVYDSYASYGKKITYYDGTNEIGFRMERIVDYAKEAGLGVAGMNFFRKVDINSYH